MGVELGSAYGRIIIDSTGVKSGVTSANASVDSFEKSVKAMTAGVAKAMGIATGSVALMKKAFNFAEEGAQVEQMRDSWGTLLDVMEAAPDLLDQLRRASRGTIDDYKLMSSTATLLAGTQGALGTALANATPELMEMAKAAQKLNPELGDVTFLYDSLAKGIKRNSPMILDNLGIIVKLEEAYADYAESLGKSADELTAEEQKIALLNAVLKQGDVLMAQVGGTVDSATDSYQRMGAAVKNAMDDLKMLAADGLRPSADGLYWVLTYQKQLNQSLDEANESLLHTSRSYDDYLQALTENLVLAGKMTQAEQEYVLNSTRAARVLADLERQYGALTDEQVIALRETGKLDAATADLLLTYSYEARNLGEVTKASGTYTEKQWEQYRAIEEIARKEEMLAGIYSYQVTPAVNDAADATENLAKKQEEQRKETERLEGALADLQTTISGELGESNREFAEQEKELIDKAAELRGKMEELSAVANPTEAQQEDLQELRGELEEVNTALAKNATAHEERTRRIVFDLLTERAAMEGLTSDELTLLSRLAEQWGLIDADTVKAIGTIDGALNDLANGASMESVLHQMESLKGWVDGIAGEYDIRFNISSVGSLGPMPGSQVGTWQAPLEMATGGQFVVPPGYPDDSFLVELGLTSGEEVTVRRPGEQSETNDNRTQNLTMNFYGSQASRPAAARSANTMKALLRD